jgi:hypothetical protein
MGVLGLALTIFGGCVYRQAGPPEAHFKEFSTKAPMADSVTVCHAYGCKAQTPFTFTPSDIAEVSSVMMRVRRDDSPREEAGPHCLCHRLDGAARSADYRNGDRPAQHGFFGLG